MCDPNLCSPHKDVANPILPKTAPHPNLLGRTTLEVNHLDDRLRPTRQLPYDNQPSTGAVESNNRCRLEITEPASLAGPHIKTSQASLLSDEQRLIHHVNHTKDRRQDSLPAKSPSVGI